ncbi:MAG: glutaredoxin family protein [Enterococcus faecalis]
MSKKITIYASERCKYCIKLKDWLEEKELEFTAIDSNTPSAARFLREKKVLGVPFSIIEDRETKEKDEIIGFNLPRFEEIFGV